jgi:hypothetical protein
MNVVKTVWPLPNFIYIGPDKAGSSWLFQVLKWHPDTYVTPAKDIYFFDRFFQRGVDWYRQQFEGAEDCRVIGEISHDYLFSMEAVERMANLIPDVRLMVCLREPISRAFSAYLYLRKHGLCNARFESALDEHPSLIAHGMYWSHLRSYLETFGNSKIHICLFDSLEANPVQFSQDIFLFLGVQPLIIPRTLHRKTLPASTSRSLHLSRLIKSGANIARKWGFAKQIGQVKSSRMVQTLLYRPFRPDERPLLSEATRARLVEVFLSDVTATGELIGMDLPAIWGYSAGRDS